MIIYKVTNKITGKSYIGQTIKTLNIRRNGHYADVKRNKNDNNYFHNALRKYGKENFEWETIEECNSKEDLNLAEEWYIRYYNTFGKGGYNLTYGGEGSQGYKHTEESKRKIGNISKGRKLSKEWREKISKSGKGRIVSEETKRKMSECQIGKNNSFYGKTHSDETIKVISDKLSGNKNPFYGKTHSKEILEKKSRHIWRISYPNGDIKEFRVLSLWCKENNLDYGLAKYYVKVDKPYKGYKIERIKL